MATNKKKRPIDDLAKESYGWLNKRWVMVKKVELRSWKTAVILAFIVGVTVAVASIVSLQLQTTSDANEEASFFLSPSKVSIVKDGNFVINVMIDTKGYNVVAATAIINYNPSELKLLNYNTSGSIFSDENTCIYNGKPCQIIQNDTTNGKIEITMAKPSPGINATSGNFATLNFQALKIASSSNITVNFSSGSYSDSNIVIDDGAGTDILKTVSNATVAIGASSCSNFVYSDWGKCQNGTQTRTIISKTPADCVGGNPVLSQSCSDSKVCTSFSYSDWSACESNGTMTRTIQNAKPAGCSGGSPVLTESCTPNCIGFTYSAWGECKKNKQSRVVSTGIPAGCEGGDPVLQQSCKKPKCKSFKYTKWSKCKNGKATRKVKDTNPDNCSGGKKPDLTKKCYFVWF